MTFQRHDKLKLVKLIQKLSQFPHFIESISIIIEIGRICSEIRSPVSLLPQAYIPDMEMMGRQSFYLLVCSKISFKNVCLNMRDFLDMVCHPLPSNTMKLLRYFTNSLLDTDDKRRTHFSSNL